MFHLIISSYYDSSAKWIGIHLRKIDYNYVHLEVTRYYSQSVTEWVLVLLDG